MIGFLQLLFNKSISIQIMYRTTEKKKGYTIAKVMVSLVKDRPYMRVKKKCMPFH